MNKVVVGYTVQFKGVPDTRDAPINLTIAGGQSAIRQWKEGEPSIILDGNAVSFSIIARIGRRYAWSEREAQIKLESGEGITEDQATEQLAAALGTQDVQTKRLNQ